MFRERPGERGDVRVEDSNGPIFAHQLCKHKWNVPAGISHDDSQVRWRNDALKESLHVMFFF
jgi:hypothetical protein